MSKGNSKDATARRLATENQFFYFFSRGVARRLATSGSKEISLLRVVSVNVIRTVRKFIIVHLWLRKCIFRFERVFFVAKMRLRKGQPETGLNGATATGERPALGVLSETDIPLFHGVLISPFGERPVKQLKL